MPPSSRCLRVARARPSSLFSKPLRTPRPLHSRFQSTSTETKSAGSSALVGGLVGGGLVLGVGGLYYYFSGAKTTVDSLTEAKGYVTNAAKQLKEGSLSSDQTIQWLRSTASQYAALVPGGKAIVDQGFQALDEVHAEHGGELNKIINDAHSELKDLADKGSLNVESAKKAWTIVVKYLGQIEDLAESIGKDFLDKNPQLKEKYGKKLNELKEMGRKQGGEAKKYADETWSKVQDAVKEGGFDSDKIGQLIQQGYDKAQGYGKEAWDKAMVAAKPYLDKNPDVKKFMEQNGEKLKQGDFGGLVARLQEATKTGDVQSLKKWGEDQLQQLQGMGDEAWRGAMARASLYLDDNHADLKKYLEEKADVLRKTDFEQLMHKLREAKRTGDFEPVKAYVNKQAQRFKD